MLNRRRLPVHALGEGNGAGDDDEVIENNAEKDMEEMIAAFLRKKNGGRDAGRRPSTTTTTRPRRCANCGKEHKELKCPLPPVAVSDRPCWTCGKKGRVGRDCPDKRKPLKTVDEEIEGLLARLAVVEKADGFLRPAEHRQEEEPDDAAAAAQATSRGQGRGEYRGGGS